MFTKRSDYMKEIECVDTETNMCINASTAIGHYMLNKLDIRELINTHTDYSKRSILSPGDSVCLITAPLIAGEKQIPLYKTGNHYEISPLKYMVGFGKNITFESVSDTKLGINLDIISEMQMYDIYWKIYDRIKTEIDSTSMIIHMDTSSCMSRKNIPIRNSHNGIFTEFGRSSDGRIRAQCKVLTFVDNNHLLAYYKLFSGSVSDPIMFREGLQIFKDRFNTEEYILTADCKLTNKHLISKMLEMGIKFVCKCPEYFSKKLRYTLLSAVEQYVFTPSEDGKYILCDVPVNTVCGMLRAIICKETGESIYTIDYFRKNDLKDAKEHFKKLSKTKYACKKDAENAFKELRSTYKKNAYVVTGIPVLSTKDKKWKVKIEMNFDEDIARKYIIEDEYRVILTNLPTAEKDSKNLVNGASSNSIINLYQDRYKVEHTYRTMKSDMGVDSIFVHKQNRANALFFTKSVATVIVYAMEHMAREAEKSVNKLLLEEQTVKDPCEKMEEQPIDNPSKEQTQGIENESTMEVETENQLEKAIKKKPKTVREFLGGLEKSLFMHDRILNKLLYNASKLNKLLMSYYAYIFQIEFSNLLKVYPK
jgi:hypothetical protein